MGEWGNEEVISQAGLRAKIAQIGLQGFGVRPMGVVMVIDLQTNLGIIISGNGS